MQAATVTGTPTPATARGGRITGRGAVSAPRPRTRRPLPRGLTAGLFGVGAALPEREIDNAYWEQRLDTDDEWIVRRTGIRTRRWLQDGEPLAPLAAQRLRRRAGRRGPHARRGRPDHRHHHHARPRHARAWPPRSRG